MPGTQCGCSQYQYYCYLIIQGYHGRLNKGSPKMSTPHPDPGDLRMCYLQQQRDFADVIKLRVLRCEATPWVIRVGPKCDHWGLMNGRQSGIWLQKRRRPCDYGSRGRRRDVMWGTGSLSRSRQTLIPPTDSGGRQSCGRVCPVTLFQTLASSTVGE